MSRHVDMLVDIPYLWFNDGYGQSTPIVVRMLLRYCHENNLSFGIKKPHVLAARGSVDADEIRGISKYFVNIRDISSCTMLFRYNYPSMERHNASRMVTLTMFETDRCPDAWKPALDSSDLVLVPSPYFVNLFNECTTSVVDYLYIPIKQEYLETYDELRIVGSLKDKFIFSFAGTAGETADRKGILALCKEYASHNGLSNTTLYIRSRGFYRAFKNIEVIPESKVMPNLIDFYCSSHVGVYPSRGEGFGLPQFETSLLGRPVIVADNTSMSWAKNIIPWCIPVECEAGEALYAGRVQGNVGEWGYVSFSRFLDEMQNLYDVWTLDKDKFLNRIYSTHINNPLRDEFSHDKIYNKLSSHLTRLLEEV